MMEPLDLTLAPPRSPYAALGGLVFLPRTIDKLRAALPGGRLGLYKIGGFSARMLEILDVDEASLRDAVAEADCDDDVLAWLQERTDQSLYPAINQRFTALTIADQAGRAEFFELYPIIAERGIPPETKLFDLIELDDAALFSQSAR